MDRRLHRHQEGSDRGRGPLRQVEKGGNSIAEEEVTHPSHYGGDVVYETIKVLKEWMTPEQFAGFCRGNTIKYLSRAGKKGDLVTDLQKARFYLDYEIQTLLQAKE
jgi:hypothetical protein